MTKKRPKMQVPDGRVRRTVRRAGEFVVVRRETIYHAIVEFGWIVDACEVSDDDDRGLPWEDDPSYEHTIDRGFLAARGISSSGDKVRMPRGFVVVDRMRCVVTLDNWDAEAADFYAYYRDTVGCTRQVAAELTAMRKRRIVDQLVKWRNDGWTWYSVECDYMGLKASAYGIDDLEYATTAVVDEVAREVAAKLEKRGFEVLGVPDRRVEYRKSWIHSMKRRLREDCWED